MKLAISLRSIVLPVYSLFLLGCLHSKVEPARLPSKNSNRHAELLSKLSNYELVRPYRSTHDGEFITHELSTETEEDLHDYHRSKRDTSQSNRRTRSADDEQPRFHFTVSAFGSQFTLSVTRNRYIASPTFKVEKHMDNGERVIFRPRTNCFYTGQVENSASSTVAVSNCQGMSGLIRVDTEEYIIEPVEAPQEISANITHGHLHIMYNRKDWKGENGYLDASYNFTHPRLMDDEMYRYPANNPTESAQQSGRQKRQSISTYDREHHIETLITADYYVRDFHGDDYVVTYLMTMMHIVNVAYAHPSLEANIDLTVIRIILLNSAQSENMVVENNAPSSLTNVCQWAYSQSSPDENHPDHYDHAIFLTRENFGPAGIAMVEVMCDRWYCQWSLVKEAGLLSSYIVAHEIGHVLGMEHDGQGGNSCQEDALTGSIMAPIVIAVYNNFFWSDCSRTELHNYLWRYTCLHDDPFDNGYAELQEHPGERYSMDEQCRFDFGDGWRVCRQFGEYNPCEQLWCVDIHDPYYCKTKKGPPLDGTSCAPGMWCMQGECVYTDTERQDGAWSQWSPWSECSYQCDTGAEVRTRDCNNPPPLNGGNPCKGSNLDYRLCNTQECRRPSTDRRATQCDDNLANWQFKGRLHTWLPHENRNKSMQCRLTCISAETKDVVVTEYNVADGTPCSYDDHESVCIQGICVHIGCDKQLESPSKADICGVCMGDNTNCDLIKGRFEQQPRKNYQIVTTIPAGARNIEIREVSSTQHFLAVKQAGTKNYILNAKKRQSKSHDFVYANARFVYVNDGDVEMLASKGPIIRALALTIFWKSDSRPANITYQYHMNLLEDQNKYNNIPETKPPKPPTRVTPKPLPRGEPAPGPTEPNAIPEIDPELIIPDVGTNPNHIWEAIGWTPCSKSCDGGKTFYQYQCTSRTTGKRIKYKACGQNKYNPKGIKRNCNTQPCDSSPSTENSPSQDLGNINPPQGPNQEETGPTVNTRSTSTPNTGGGGGGGGVGGGDVDNTPIPEVQFLWEISEWEQCSRTCGLEGSQRRSVRCLKVRPSGNSSTNPNKCPGDEPPTRQPCNRTPCKAFWSTGSWSECSATCGTGTQTREVMCAAPSDRPGEFECFEDKPETSRDCEIEPCPSSGCVPMKTRICKPKLFEKYCDLPGYSDICCSTCEEMRERMAAKRSSAAELPKEGEETI